MFIAIRTVRWWIDSLNPLLFEGNNTLAGYCCLSKITNPNCCCCSHQTIFSLPQYNGWAEHGYSLSVFPVHCLLQCTGEGGQYAEGCPTILLSFHSILPPTVFLKHSVTEYWASLFKLHNCIVFRKPHCALLWGKDHASAAMH